jgi:large subunit ribosomal protein L24
MAYPNKKEIRYTNAAIAKKVKAGNVKLVSAAFVKKGATSLITHMHVKRGDTVMVVSGSDKLGAGKTGKVLNVFPKTGKLVVEGVNMITRATKAKSVQGNAGLVQKEGPIFASKVMLYCSACKKPTRIKHKIAGAKGEKKVRVCRHCSESFDG